MDWILDIILMLLKDKCLSFCLLNFFKNILFKNNIVFIKYMGKWIWLDVRY